MCPLPWILRSGTVQEVPLQCSIPSVLPTLGSTSHRIVVPLSSNLSIAEHRLEGGSARGKVWGNGRGPLNIAWKEDQLEEKYGETVEDLLGRYAKNENSDKINTQHILAGLIYQLVHHAQGYRWDFQDQITELFDMQFPDNPLPGLDDPPATPQWGPLPGEAWGEPYNRALNAFQMMTKNITRWDERHGKSNGHAPNQLDQALKPQFMKESSQTTSTAGVLLHEPVTMLDKKVFKVYWGDPEKVREDLENRFDILPNTTMIAPDPRAMGGEEWRDKIRDLFHFRRLERQFLSLSLSYIKDDEAEVLDLLSCDWSEAQEIFSTLPVDAIKRIRFKTRSLATGEVLKEFRGIPNALKKYMKTTAEGLLTKLHEGESEAEEQHPHEGSASTDIQKQGALDRSEEPPTTPQEATVEDFLSKEARKSARKAARAKIQEAKDEAFLNSTLERMAHHLGRKKDPTAGPGYPDPGKAYAKDHESRKRMIAEHNECDITDINVRHKWTSRMLQKHGDSHVVEITQQIDEQVMELSGASEVSLSPPYRCPGLVQGNPLCQSMAEADTSIVRGCKTKRKRARRITEARRKNNWLSIVLMRPWPLESNRKAQTFIFASLSWASKKTTWTAKVECFLPLQGQRSTCTLGKSMESFTCC